MKVISYIKKVDMSIGYVQYFTHQNVAEIQWVTKINSLSIEMGIVAGYRFRLNFPVSLADRLCN